MKPWRKFRPPTGPISPAHRRTGDRERAEEPVDEAGVVVGHAEEVPPAPVAGEQRARRGRRAPASSSRRSSSAAAASRTWNCTVWPTVDLVADRERARFGVGADDVAHEEVAAAELGLVLVDDETDVQPVTEQLALVVARLAARSPGAGTSRAARRALRRSSARRA